MKILLSLTSFILLFSACATQNPAMIPVIKTESLPAFSFKNIKSKTIDIKVKVTRKVNIDAKNTSDIADRVKAALTELATRGGYSVQKSKTILTFEVQDCEKAVEGSACVAATVNFDSPAARLEYTAQSSNGYPIEGKPSQDRGDLSKAYEQVIELAMSGLNTKLSE